jgi:chorismate dehydratase
MQNSTVITNSEFMNNIDNRDSNIIRVSIVSYTNSIAFTQGLKEKLTSNFIVKNQIPRDCSESFRNGEADIALVPVASLLKTENYKIIEPYCIGAQSIIKTVSLLSNTSLEKIKKVYLDSHSLTSINLFKLIAKKHLKQEFDYIDCPREFDYKSIKEGEAIVAIGDKVFELENIYNFNFDLAQLWEKYTNKGFVFAVWIAHKSISQEVINQLNFALKYGIKNINHISKDFDTDKKNYIKNLVKYELTPELKSGMDLYLKELQKMNE